MKTIYTCADVTSFTQYMETIFIEMNKDKYSIFITGAWVLIYCSMILTIVLMIF